MEYLSYFFYKGVILTTIFLAFLIGNGLMARASDYRIPVRKCRVFLKKIHSIIHI